MAATLTAAILLESQSTPQAPAAQGQAAPQQPEFVRQAQQLMRAGRLDEALAVYQSTLKNSPDSLPALNGAGVILDLMGKGAEARTNFTRAIEMAPNPQAKAGAQRAMAMSYAFEGDCARTVEYERQVFNYYVSTNDFYQQGEIADEAARVCIDSGDLEAARKWYQTGHDAGLKEPGIKPDRQDLWEFRWEHAQARLAARKGDKAEAQKHVAAAKAILDKGTNPTQAPFFPYLAGYVALYTGDYKGALENLQQANQNDAFIQCLIAQAYEELGDKTNAVEYYRKASTTVAHNPPAAYARRITKAKLAGS